MELGKVLVKLCGARGATPRVAQLAGRVAENGHGSTTSIGRKKRGGGGFGLSRIGRKRWLGVSSACAPGSDRMGDAPDSSSFVRDVEDQATFFF